MNLQYLVFDFTSIKEYLILTHTNRVSKVKKVRGSNPTTGGPPIMTMEDALFPRSR